MSRIRTIKPEILDDERTAALTSDAFRLFVGLITLADDYGNARGHLGYLEGHIFWAAPQHAGVEDLAAELETAGLILSYEIRGQVYIHLRGWSKHQKVDKPGSPRVPGPEKAESTESFANGSRIIRESFAPDLDLDLRSVPVPLPPPPAPTATGGVCVYVRGSIEPWEPKPGDVADWQDVYPLVPVEEEIRKMREWTISNPSKQPSFATVRNFVTSWLNREQRRLEDLKRKTAAETESKRKPKKEETGQGSAAHRKYDPPDTSGAVPPPPDVKAMIAQIANGKRITTGPPSPVVVESVVEREEDG